MDCVQLIQPVAAYGTLSTDGEHEKAKVTTVCLPKDLIALAKMIGDGNVSSGIRRVLTNLRTDRATMLALYSRIRPIDGEAAASIRCILGLADDTPQTQRERADTVIPDLPAEARIDAQAKGTGVLDDLWV